MSVSYPVSLGVLVLVLTANPSVECTPASRMTIISMSADSALLLLVLKTTSIPSSHDVGVDENVRH